jgi:AcrR family transcriptional regulator
MPGESPKKVSSLQRKRAGPKTAQTKTRQRLAPALRRAQIMDAAAELIVNQGFLPLSMERLGDAAGSSKSLIYAYFPTQFDLFNALLERELNSLVNVGLDAVSKLNDFERAAQQAAMLYFEHVVQVGPLIHILLTDLHMADHIDPRATRAGKVMLARLVRLACRSLDLTKKEVTAALQMIAAIPEEAGSLAHHGELRASVARELCRKLMLSSLEALRSGGTAVSGDHTA